MSHPTIETTATQQDVVIDQVLSEIQRALQDAVNRTIGAQFPELASVGLTLQTVVTKSVGGKVKILIFSFGRKWEKEKAHEVTLTLKPPTAVPGALAPTSFATELADAIVQAAEGVKNAATGNPPLLLDQFKASVSFVVTESGSGGFKIEPVNFELTGDLKKKALHKVELVFKKRA